MKQFISLTLMIFLSSCALLGPEYKAPTLTQPTCINQTDCKNIITANWWKKFNDKQLNGLIESALINNNDINAAVGNILTAKAGLKKVEMTWVPNIFLGGMGFAGQSFNSTFSNKTGNPSYDNLATGAQNFNGYGVGFVPEYTVNILSQIKMTEIAKLNIQLQEETVKAVRLSIISQMSASYFNLLGLKQQLIIQNQMLKHLEEMLYYTKIQSDNGVASNMNIIGLEQGIDTVRARIPDIKHKIHETENIISVLMNESPHEISTINTIDNLDLSNITPSNIPSSVLQMRPDVAIATYQLKLSNANIGAVTSQFFPTISLSTPIGYSSMALENLFTTGSDFWTGQLGVFAPVFDLSMMAEIDKAKGAYHSAYYNYIKTVRSAFANTNTAFNAYSSNVDIYNLQFSSYNHAKELLEIANTQYKLGTISYANTILLYLNLDNALSTLNRAKIQELNSIVSLYGEIS